MAIDYLPDDDIPAELSDLIEKFIEQLQAGQKVDLETAIREHPEHADDLRRMVPTLQLLVNTQAPGPEAPPVEPTSARWENLVEFSLSVDKIDGVPQVVGDYQIIGKIGRGGMGVVFKAEDTRLNRDVALKFLPSLRTNDTSHRDRLIQEARSASALNHPNILTIYDIEEVDGELYVAMEYLRGTTLREQMSTAPMDPGVQRIFL